MNCFSAILIGRSLVAVLWSSEQVCWSLVETASADEEGRRPPGGMTQPADSRVPALSSPCCHNNGLWMYWLRSGSSAVDASFHIFFIFTYILYILPLNMKNKKCTIACKKKGSREQTNIKFVSGALSVGLGRLVSSSTPPVRWAVVQHGGRCSSRPRSPTRILSETSPAQRAGRRFCPPHPGPVCRGSGWDLEVGTLVTKHSHRYAVANYASRGWFLHATAYQPREHKSTSSNFLIFIKKNSTQMQ
jgi:hypothetical protein